MAGWCAVEDEEDVQDEFAHSARFELIYRNLVNTPVTKDDFRLARSAIAKGRPCTSTSGGYRAGIDVNAALRTAILQLDYTIIESLVELGADVNLPHSDGEVPLSSAIKFSSLGIAAMLLYLGADVNAVCNDKSILQEAVECNNLQKLILVLNFDPDVTKKSNRSAFHVAENNEKEEMLQVLLDYGFCYIPGDDGNIVYGAILQGDIGVLKELLTYKKYLQLVRDPVSSPLHFACEFQNLEIVQLLLEHGADPNANGDFDLIPLSKCIQLEDYTIFDFLLPLVDTVQLTRLLPYALTWKTDIAFVKGLLRYGADVNYLYDECFEGTALHVACANCDKATVKLILNYGADVDVVDSVGQTPLFYAARTDVSNCESIVNAGANINAIDDLGRSPLHIAATHQMEDIVRLLCERGADISIHDDEDQTPLDCARIDTDTRIPGKSKCGIKNSTKSLAYLEKHLDKINAMQPNFSEKIKDLCPKIFETFSQTITPDDSTNYLWCCFREVNCMKMDKVPGCDITFYDLLICQTEELGRIMRKARLNEPFHRSLFRGWLIIYDDLIEGKSKNATMVSVVREKCRENFFSRYFPVPDLCFEKIFDYLSYQDLRMLNIAGKMNIVFRSEVVSE